MFRRRAEIAHLDSVAASEWLDGSPAKFDETGDIDIKAMTIK
jgi:hypothetical protein